jgi:hypothetical protein
MIERFFKIVSDGKQMVISSFLFPGGVKELLHCGGGMKEWGDVRVRI